MEEDKRKVEMSKSTQIQVLRGDGLTLAGVCPRFVVTDGQSIRGPRALATRWPLNLSTATISLLAILLTKVDRRATESSSLCYFFVLQIQKTLHTRTRSNKLPMGSFVFLERRIGHILLLHCSWSYNQHHTPLGSSHIVQMPEEG